MSHLVQILDALKKTKAEQIRLVPGERVHLFVEGRRQDIGREAIPASAVLATAGEVISQDELRGLGARPRIVRHEHEGRTYVIELVGGAAGLTMTIRPGGAAAAPARPRASWADDPNDPASAATPEAPASAPLPTASYAPPPVAHAPPVSAVQPPRSAVTTAGAGAGVMGGLELALDPDDARAARRSADPETPFRRVPTPPPPAGPGPAAVPPPSALPVVPVRPRPTPMPMAAVRVPSQGGARRIDELLRDMIARKASDLHLSAENVPVMRTHGEIEFLTERGPLTGDAIFGMMKEIFSEKAERDFAELRDADFAYEVPGLARFRVNVFEDRKGVGAVLRQIPIEILSAEKLGLSKAILDLCYLSKGLVVVTGPTGSGKSTTLAGMIDFINDNRNDHIITIEDPVEFVHPNKKCLVNQREVGQHTKSFKAALRAALREDPDIVLVGEMRDLETISIAIETAETGHLVFGTLHTTTATSTIDRIIDQFPADRQSQIRVMLSEALKGVVAQVLCKKIGGGRVAAQEVLIVNHAVSALIRDGKTFQIASVMQTSKGIGMRTMNDSLFDLVQKKLVEPKEAYIKAVDKSGLLAMFKGANIPSPV